MNYPRRGLAAMLAALALAARPTRAQQPATPPNSQILDVTPTIIEPGEDVIIMFREGRILAALREGSPVAITVTIGGRLAQVVSGSPGGIAVRAPRNLEIGRPLPVIVTALGERTTWEEPVFAANRSGQASIPTPAVPTYVVVLLVSLASLAVVLFVRMRQLAQQAVRRAEAEGHVAYLRARKEAEMQEAALRASAESDHQRAMERARSAEMRAAEAERRTKAEMDKLRFALDRLQQGRDDAQPATATGLPPVAPAAPAPPLVIPRSLLADLAAGRCTLFWGSGLSAQAGYPTWGVALPALLEQVEGDPKVAGLELHRLAREKPALALEVVLAKLGQPATLDLLRAQWDRAHAPTPAMRTLGGMPFANIVTSAWDPLPAEVFRHRDPVVLSRLERDSLAPLLRPDIFSVLHIWGAFGREGRVLLTEADYRATVAGNPEVAKHITSLLLSQTHLFIGASLASIEQYFATGPLGDLDHDPGNASRGGDVRRTHYALIPAEPQIELLREVMRARYRLELLVFEPDPSWSAVPRFIDALRALLPNDISSDRIVAVEPLRVEQVDLKNIGPFESASLRLDERWNVLLGNNGDGKSMVLRAIALALCGDDTRALNEGARLLRNGATEGSVKLVVGGTPHETRLLRDTKTGRVEIRPPTQASPLVAGRWAVLGFPALRGVPGINPPGPVPTAARATPRVEDVLPLLTGAPDSRLASLKQWLVNLEVGPDPRRADELRTRFFDVLNEFVPGLSIRPGRVDRETWTVHVEVNGDNIPLDQVSQGTGALFGWIGSLLLRMQEIHGDGLEPGATPPTHSPAVVLIDEIDAHLHPAWQQRIVPTLSRQFPQVQFIASTHSPLIVAELKQEQVFRMRRRDRAATIEPLGESPAGLGVAGLLTGEAFSLASAIDSHTQELLEGQRRLALKDKLTAEDRQQLKKLNSELAERGFGAQLRDPVFARYLRASERLTRRAMDAPASVELAEEEIERLVAAALAEEQASGKAPASRLEAH